MELNTSKTDWDLSHLIKDSKDIPQKRKESRAEVEKFVNKWKENQDYKKNPKSLKEALDEYETLCEKYFGAGEEGRGEIVAYYYWLKSEQDNTDPEVKASFNKAIEENKEIEDKIRFFELDLAKISSEKQKEFLEAEELKEYNHFLKRLFESGKHRLTEKEEKILSLKESPASSMWQKMSNSILLSEEREIETKKGKEKKNFSEIQSLLNDRDKKTRDSAAKAFNDIIEKNLDITEAEINALYADKKVNDTLRKFEKPESARLLDNDIGLSTIDTLLETIQENYSLAQKYYELKAKLLKVPKLAYHERNIPYGDIEIKYSYKDAINLTYNVFKNLDEEFAALLKQFAENGQIDVFPKKGKTGGAFCVYWLKSHPTYILLNHTDQLTDVTTLAHEAGHAINNELSRKKQNALYYGTSTATAEVASTFMEDFVLEELLKKATDEEKLTILMEKLNSDISSIIRQVACFLFERELHETFRKKGYLSKLEIGKIFQKHMAAYMGPAVELSPGSQNWWAYWSHIRMFFYTYSYSSGLLISKALQKKVRENPAFITNVKEFLAAGISDSPEKIFNSLGIDITKKEFWLSGLKEVEDLLSETEQLAKQLGKI